MDSIQLLTGAAAVAEGEANVNDGGFRAPATARTARLVEAANTWGDALTMGGIGGMKARVKLAESLATPDFPFLLGGVFDRELLAQYQAAPATWSQFAKRTTVRDFRPKELLDLLGGQSILSAVGQGAEYPARKVTEGKYSLTVGKRGARIPLTWEMIVNDELDAFRDLPQRLAVGARETEDYLAAGLLVKAGGINTDFFKTANGNAPANLPLTEANLAAALTAISTRKDSDGRPIVVTAARLVVPPSLEIVARRILNATEIRVTDGNTTSIQDNYLRGVVTLVVDPWLGVIDQSANAAKSWFLLPDPNGARPAVTLGFLRGHENPDLRVKADTGNRVGGGAIAPEDGSFDDDTIQYRVRHVLGSAHVDPIATYASNGSGS